MCIINAPFSERGLFMFFLVPLSTLLVDKQLKVIVDVVFVQPLYNVVVSGKKTPYY